MSHISNDEFDSGVDDEFPDAMLEWYFGVSEYLSIGKMPIVLTKAQ